MNYTKRIIALVLALIMSVSLLASCGEKGEEPPLRISLKEGITTLDPARITTETERIVVSHLFENLMKITSGGQVVGGVAKTYQCEDNLDGTQTYTFQLRSDARWSDGEPVTADDFVYAWRRLADPDTNSPHAALLDMVAGYQKVRSSGDSRKLKVKAVSDHVLEVVLAHRCSYFIDEICTSPVTMPVRRSAVKEKNWSMQAETLRCNGPYCHLTAWTEDGMTAEAQEAYYDYKRLGPKALDFLFYEDETADFQMGLSEETIAAMPETWSPDPYPQTTAVVLNQLTQNLRDKNLRQAMALVIDRAGIARMLGGENCYVPAKGLVPFGITNTAGEEFRTAAGPAMENAPLEGTPEEIYEIHCQQAAERMKEVKNLPAVVKLSYPATTMMESIAVELQRVWQEKLGLNVQLRPMGEKEMAKALRKGDFSVALTTLESDRGDASGMLDDWRSGAKKNFANIHYSAYDLLMRISDNSSSAEARDAYLADAERMLMESAYVMPLYHVTQTALLRSGLTGLVYDGMGVYHFGNVVKVK